MFDSSLVQLLMVCQVRMLFLFFLCFFVLSSTNNGAVKNLHHECSTALLVTWPTGNHHHVIKYSAITPCTCTIKCVGVKMTLNIKKHRGRKPRKIRKLKINITQMIKHWNKPNVRTNKRMKQLCHPNVCCFLFSIYCWWQMLPDVEWIPTQWHLLHDIVELI